MNNPIGPEGEPQELGQAAAEVLQRRVASLLHAVDQGLTGTLARHELIPVELELLRFCRDRGECTVTQMTGVLPTDPSRVSRLVHGLVQMGLVGRRRLTDDRRVVMLRLTPEGEELVQRLDALVQDFYDALTEGVSEADLAIFLSASERMVDNYEAYEQTRLSGLQPGNER